jgi:hypothetical protein
MRQTKQNKKILEKQFYVSLSFFGVMFCLVASYVYFVNSTILTIAATHDLQDSISDVRADMTHLEVAYLQKQEIFTEEYALGKGFVSPEETQYVKDTTIRTAALYGQTIQE